MAEDFKVPFIIAFEGVDGSFKHTQSYELKEAFERKKYNVLHMSFPNYGGTYCELIEDYFDFVKYERPLPPLELSRLFLYDIFFTYYTKLIEEIKLNAYDVIIFDRYIYSNLYYQTANMTFGLDIENFEKKYWDLINLFNLPHANLVVKMIHNNNDKITEIIRNRNRYENNFNEDNTKYLIKVQDRLKVLNTYTDTYTCNLEYPDGCIKDIDTIANEIGNFVFEIFNEFEEENGETNGYY